MVALLRFMYDLPFDDEFDKRCNLQAYAKVYIAADKYQVQGLKRSITDKMKHSIGKKTTSRSFLYTVGGNVEDFLAALRTIIIGTTTHDVLAREAMVEGCVANLRYLHNRPELLSLLRQSADLGAAIVGHQDLEYGTGGAWARYHECNHIFDLACPGCNINMGEEFARRNRSGHAWNCPQCGVKILPTCMFCRQPITWLSQTFK